MLRVCEVLIGCFLLACGTKEVEIQNVEVANQNASQREFEDETSMAENLVGDAPRFYNSYQNTAYRRRAFHRIPQKQALNDHFLCDFEQHECGMRNQRYLRNKWSLTTGDYRNPGRYFSLRANVYEYSVARLITPYLYGFPNKIACISLQYILYGPGVEGLRVIAQDKENRYVMNVTNLYSNREWSSKSVEFFVEQDVRFFLEARMTGLGHGYAGIDNFSYKLRPCFNRGIKREAVLDTSPNGELHDLQISNKDP